MTREAILKHCIDNEEVNHKDGYKLTYYGWAFHLSDGNKEVNIETFKSLSIEGWDIK